MGQTCCSNKSNLKICCTMSHCYNSDINELHCTDSNEMLTSINIDREKIFNQNIEKYPKQISPNGVIYQGELNKQQIRHGFGKLTWPNNSYYIGHFENNISTGYGILRFNADEMMEGDWKNDQLNGKGTMTTKNFTYSGEFHNGLPHFEGKFSYTIGASYEGEIINGLKHGKGKLTTANLYYEGLFENDMRHGFGYCEWKKDGTKYEGNWSKNKLHGKGTYFWPNGFMYEGEYEDGLKNGFGVLKKIDGKIIEKGYWLKGNRFEAGNLF